MHDLRLIRDNPEAFDRGLARRGVSPMAGEILELDARRRAAQTILQEIQARRNEASKEIGKAKREGRDADALMAEVAGLKDRIQQIEEEERAAGATLEGFLVSLPNLPADDVPDGPDKTANVELRRVGEPPRINTAQEHFDLGEKLGMMDFSAGAKLSGARFTVLRGKLARLERALGQLMLDLHVNEHGFTEVMPPLLVRDEAAFGTGQLPKFSEDLFRTNTGHWLIPTAEVPLTNLVADRILDLEDLPLRMTALTPCFRSEAGAAGKDTRGMIRQHQFEKVELVSVAHPDRSVEEHERMTAAPEEEHEEIAAAAGEVLKRPGLAYRVVLLCAGDMSFASRKTYDIEVWLPG